MSQVATARTPTSTCIEPRIGARRSEAGLTLVELLVALAVVAFLSVLLTPAISSVLPGRELDRAVTELRTDMELARAAAIANGIESTFTIDVAGQPSWSTAGRRHALPDGVTVRAVVADSGTPIGGTGSIVFFPDGTSTGARLELAYRGRAATLRVDWFDGRVDRVD